MYREIKILAPFFLFSLFINKLSAQLQADNWIYKRPDLIYVNFNKATEPVALPIPPFAELHHSANAASVCYSDENGQLLFYADGVYVYDRNFQIMPSCATSIGPIPPLLSAFAVPVNLSQSQIAVPYPGRDSLYILFHINSHIVNNYISPLYYTIINMNRHNGLGDLDVTQENMPLLGGVDVAYKLTAVLHCNKKDIWVIGHLSNSDKYFSILVTANGVSSTPVYFSGQFISNSYKYEGVSLNSIGCTKTSALGDKLASAFFGTDFVELLDFNTTTGIGSNARKLNINFAQTDTIHDPFYPLTGPWGIDFSPSGNKLYVSGTYIANERVANPVTAYVFQYDVSLPTTAQIERSQYVVDKQVDFHNGGAIQIANNGKMYVNISSRLNEIANPENSGAACNYTRLKMPFTTGFYFLNLPSYLQSYFKYPVVSTAGCLSKQVSFSLKDVTGVSDVLWDFGDPLSGASNNSTSYSPIHVFSSDGIYKVKAILQNANGCGADTIIKVTNAGLFKVSLGNDTSFCEGDSVILKIKIPQASIEWSNGQTDTAIVIKEPGTYWVKANFGECSASDTIAVTMLSLPKFSLGNDTVSCSNKPVQLLPNNIYNSANYLWSNGEQTPKTTVSNQGEYWLSVKDNKGCVWKDTVIVSFKTLPDFNLGNDTLLCANDSLLLDATVNNASSYLWNTSSKNAIFKATKSDIYWCDVTKDGCTYRDSIIINVKPLPVVALGKDTVLCEDETLSLNVINTNSSYLWQDGSTNSNYTVSQKGLYYVTVTMNNCKAKDSIKIEYNLKPKFTLGQDKFICNGQPLLLQPNISSSQYLWQDGSTSQNYTVTQPGLYILTVANECGETKDSILISQGVCELYIPSAFSPNGDGRNDVFRAGFGENITQYNLKIFNRYGQLLFETNNKSEGWDGKYKNKLMQAGAYIYLVQYQSAGVSKLQQQKGSLLLMR